MVWVTWLDLDTWFDVFQGKNVFRRAREVVRAFRRFRADAVSTSALSAQPEVLCGSQSGRVHNRCYVRDCGAGVSLSDVTCPT